MSLTTSALFGHTTLRTSLRTSEINVRIDFTGAIVAKMGGKEKCQACVGWYNGDMGRENLSNIHIEGKGRVKVTRGDTTIILDESGAHRKSVDNGKAKEAKKPEFPEGTLESLRPLLRQVFDSGFEDEGYWAKIVDKAIMDPNTAVNRLRNAGKSHLEVAKALVESDPEGHENIEWGKIDESQVQAKISEVAKILLPFYK